MPTYIALENFTFEGVDYKVGDEFITTGTKGELLVESKKVKQVPQKEINP